MAEQFPVSGPKFILRLLLASTVSLQCALCLNAPEGLAQTKKGGESKATVGGDKSKIVWNQWDESLFARAKKENKFVLLDLEAVWCHWCHVMDKETYSDPAVARILNSKYICVRVDQDSRPDLSNKYEDYGWPATIIFNGDGVEIVKRSGFIRPDNMTKLLNAIVADPSPEKETKERLTYSDQTLLNKSLKDELLKKHIGGYDTKYGSWGTFQKFLDWDSVEYSMELGLKGDKPAEKRARDTLVGQLNLLDPVWGGVYQYSTDGDWKHPHFEKIMQMQAENLRMYALGYMLYGDKRFLQAATKIGGYLNGFLSSPDGAFYTSQDADLEPGKHSEDFFNLNDQARRKRGIPRVDKHIYARENGWAIKGITYLYMATGDKSYLDRAVKAADWIIAKRSLPGGGFSHDSLNPAEKAGGPYLGDTLSMGRAFVALYEATADRKWLGRAEQCADFIDKHFNNFLESAQGKKAIGYLTADSTSRKVARPEPLLDENIMTARFTNLLFHYSGKKNYKAMAEQAMRYLATPQVARRRKILVAGILLADKELSSPPLHITVVGGKKDANAIALYDVARKSPAVYRRIEWYDRAEGSLPNMDVEYPELKKAAAFSCGDGTCSRPAYDPVTFQQMVRRSGN